MESQKLLKTLLFWFIKILKQKQKKIKILYVCDNHASDRKMGLHPLNSINLIVIWYEMLFNGTRKHKKEDHKF